MSGRARAVEPVLGLVAQPGVARAVVLTRRVAAALQHHGAVLSAPTLRALTEVRRAPVKALAVRAWGVSEETNSSFLFYFHNCILLI